MLKTIQLTLLCLIELPLAYSLLYPQESLTREVKSLDGFWKFRLSPSLEPQLGFENHWYANSTAWYSDAQNVRTMPVPSSYNDIPTDGAVRDFVGWAWYYRTFYVPSSWNNQVRILWVHFGIRPQK